jgi:hypothetical protein
MKTYGRVEVSCQLHAPAALLPEKSTLAPIVDEAGWAPEPVWTLWKTEKSCTCWESNPGHPVRIPPLYGLSCRHVSPEKGVMIFELQFVMFHFCTKICNTKSPSPPFLVPRLVMSACLSFFDLNLMEVCVKWVTCHHSSPSSSVVKNGGVIHQLPHTPSCHRAKLIKRRAKFTFTLSYINFLLLHLFQYFPNISKNINAFFFLKSRKPISSVHKTIHISNIKTAGCCKYTYLNFRQCSSSSQLHC